MSDYTSASEIKTALNISVTTYDSTLGTIATAVSRTIDDIQGSRYFSTDETRYYTAHHPYHDLNIDDLNTLGTITVDAAGTGSYDTTWTLGTHFSLEPINNALEGKPYRLVRVIRQSGAYFPCYNNAVKIVGSFGWSSTPETIKQAALLLGTRIFQRKDAPFGAIAVGGFDSTAVMRIARTDPDVMFLLEHTDRRQSRPLA